MARETTPPWVYIGCGCVAIIGLAIAGVTVFGFLGVSKMQGYVEDLENPDARRERVARILGARELPPGYNAQFFISVPFVMDLALLSDAPAYEGDFEEGDEPQFEPGRRGLFFIALRDFDDDRERIRARFESEDPEVDVADLEADIDVPFDFRADELLAQGRLALPAHEVLYATHRGTMRLDGDTADGVATAVFADCPDDARLRLAWWYQTAEPAEPTAAETEATPAEATPVEAPPESIAAEATDLVGLTEADYGEDAVRAFFGHFNLCSV